MYVQKKGGKGIRWIFFIVAILLCAMTTLIAVCTAEQVDLFLLMDGSGSISAANYSTQLRGYACAIKDPEVIPQDGSVLLCVIMFGYPPTHEHFFYYHKPAPPGYIPYARVIVPPTVITNQTVANSIADTINNTPQPGDHTPMAEAFILANKTLTAAIQAGIAQQDALHIIDISSDGRPNWIRGGFREVPEAAVDATFQARDDAVLKGYFDRVNVLGVDIMNEGPRPYPYNRDFLYLLRYPQPGAVSLGFYMEAANWTVFPEKIREKIMREIPRLTITKKVDRAECHPGDILTYTINYSSTGNLNLTKVILTDAVPADTTVVNGSISGGGSINDSNITWNIGNLGIGASGTQSFRVIVHGNLVNGTLIRNVATIDSNETLPISDFAVTTVIVKPIYNLVAYKTVDKKFAAPNDTLVYSIHLRNAGTVTLTGVKIKDGIPENTTYIRESMSLTGIPLTDAADSDRGTFFISNNTLIWDVGTLEPGAIEEATFKVRIDPFVPQGTVINNTATLWSNETPSINRSVITIVRIPQKVPVLMPAGLAVLVGLLIAIGYLKGRSRSRR